MFFHLYFECVDWVIHVNQIYLVVDDLKSIANLLFRSYRSNRGLTKMAYKIGPRISGVEIERIRSSQN